MSRNGRKQKNKFSLWVVNKNSNYKNQCAGECEEGRQCKRRVECPAFEAEEAKLATLTSFSTEWLKLAKKLAALNCNGEENWVCCETYKETGGFD